MVTAQPFPYSAILDIVAQPQLKQKPLAFGRLPVWQVVNYFYATPP